MGWKLALVLAVAGLAGAVYWLQYPVPDGFSSKSAWQIGLTNSFNKLIHGWAKAGEFLGIGSYMRNVRSTMRYMSSLLGNRNKTDVGIRTEDTTFDGVPVRIYTPLDKNGPLPGFVWYHGGGWALGSVKAYHTLVAQLCKDTGVVYVSVEYRLAPENRFPAGHEDCVRATKHLLLHAARFNVDPLRVAVGGDSAGGNLAATVALKLRDEGFQPPLKLQILIYPSLQVLDFHLPSMIQNAAGPVLTYEHTALFKSQYIDGSADRIDVYRRNAHVPRAVRQTISDGLYNVTTVLPSEFLDGYVILVEEEGDAEVWNEIKDRALSPYMSPLLAADLSRLPPAWLLTCQHDVLRDEGFLFAHRLRAAGADVTHQHSPIGFHGIVSFAAFMPEAAAIVDGLTAYIRERL